MKFKMDQKMLVTKPSNNVLNETGLISECASENAHLVFAEVADQHKEVHILSLDGHKLPPNHKASGRINFVKQGVIDFEDGVDISPLKINNLETDTL